jgi:hypothetical protein
MPLLEKLISALNSPDVLSPFISNLLNMVQLMAAHGTPEISRRLVPEITRWMNEPPKGRVPGQIATHAFALAHFNDATLDMEFDLGWLAFQMVRKLDVEGQILGLAWTKKTLLTKTTTHLPVAFHQNLVIATKTDPSLARQALHNLEAILFRLCIHVSDGKEEAIIGVLHYMENALRSNSSELLEWSSETGLGALQFLTDWCAENLPWLSKDSNPNLRGAIGTLISTLQSRGQISGVLSQVLGRLNNDNRARVRFAARGGWNAIRF